MSINGNKSVCMGIGARFNKHHCANISIQVSRELNWVQSCCYDKVIVCITVESACHFKGNISEAKKSFYRSFNAICGRVGQIA